MIEGTRETRTHIIVPLSNHGKNPNRVAGNVCSTALLALLNEFSVKDDLLNLRRAFVDLKVTETTN